MYFYLLSVALVLLVMYAQRREEEDRERGLYYVLLPLVWVCCSLGNVCKEEGREREGYVMYFYHLSGAVFRIGCVHREGQGGGWLYHVPLSLAWSPECGSITSIPLQVRPETVSQRRGVGRLLLPRIHQCTYCSYSTTNAGHLKRHLYKHTGEKPYACPYCSYSCTHDSNLKAHIRVHTGEKPYSCDHCPYRATQKGTLLAHLIKHKQPSS